MKNHVYYTPTDIVKNLAAAFIVEDMKNHVYYTPTGLVVYCL